MARAAQKSEKNAGSATLLYYLYYVELPYDSHLTVRFAAFCAITILGIRIIQYVLHKDTACFSKKDSGQMNRFSTNKWLASLRNKRKLSNLFISK